MDDNRDILYPPSRQDRVLEAKAAFGRNLGAASPRDPVALTGTESFGGEKEGEEIRHPFRLLRVMMAWMLILVLIIAFYNGFSYQGFDRHYVQQILNDDSSWKTLEKKVQSAYQSVMKQLDETKGNNEE